MTKKVNIIAKGKAGAEYIITDMIATRLSEEQFNKIKELNRDRFDGYRYIANEDTDFSWWSRITKKLTPTRIVPAEFDIDFYGNITEYRG